MRTLLWLISFGFAAAENGIEGWLRYAALPTDVRGDYAAPNSIVALNNTKTSPVYMAKQELQKGIHGILGQSVNISSQPVGSKSTITVGTIESFTSTGNNTAPGIPELEDDGFWLDTKDGSVQIVGQNERGALYGAFEYLSMLAQGNFSEVAYASNPSAPIRWVNKWDDLNGHIERGYVWQYLWGLFVCIGVFN